MMTGGRCQGKTQAAQEVLRRMYAYWAENLVWGLRPFGMSFYLCCNAEHEICLRTMDGVLWNLETGEVSS